MNDMRSRGHHAGSDGHSSDEADADSTSLCMSLYAGIVAPDVTEGECITEVPFNEAFDLVAAKFELTAFPFRWKDSVERVKLDFTGSRNLDTLVI